MKEVFEAFGGDITGCIEACRNCADSCLETVNYCLRMGSNHATQGHIQLMIHCAAICNLSADFMLGNSTFHARLCGLCADVCNECGDSCAAFKDDFMQRCVEACMTCAESCRKMAAAKA